MARARPGSRQLSQRVAQLGEYIAGARDCCALAWDGGEAPSVVAASGAVEAVFGLGAKALIGRPVATLFAGGERAAHDLSLLCAQAPASEQRPMLHAGKPFAAELLLTGAPNGGVIALVRSLPAARLDADAAQRAEDLGRFASLVAHEVRNPLSAVKIALQTLERHGSLAQNDLRRVAIATREVGNIELLLNEVLEFARPPSLSLVPLDPRVPVREAVEGVELEFAARGVRFVLALPERMGRKQADPVRIRTAVKILCRQAALAAEEVGGQLVQVALGDGPGDAWELSVTDPGHTLPEELREKAFVPFTPHRARGSGLGLAVIARVAHEHGGDARLEPVPEGGNRIRMTFSDRT